MAYSLKMFDSKPGVIVVRSTGYASIVPHSHEFVEIAWIKKGQGMSLVGGKFAKLNTGDLFIIADRSIRHSIQPTEGGEELEIVNVIFPFEFYDLDWSLFNPLTVVPVDKIKAGREILLELEREYEGKYPHYEKKLRALALLLLAEYLREVSRFRAGARDGKGTQKIQLTGYIEKAVNFIHANYDRPLSVEEVANECGLCKAYLQRIFKKEASTTVKECIIKYRIEQSCKLLLSTEYPVTTIAEMVGFFNMKYFYLKFKEIVGDSPKNYRNVKRSLKE